MSSMHGISILKQKYDIYYIKNILPTESQKCVCIMISVYSDFPLIMTYVLMGTIFFIVFINDLDRVEGLKQMVPIAGLSFSTFKIK